ncbi:MAG: zinc ribbon domain-containing protein [Lachnospiraceae bacterium]|jgi:DNA-directed RNA polymerase subunit RPC12/RpoP|nr:zinc ribbon domain-containing protein [Lachnospiraceae bacterium]
MRLVDLTCPNCGAQLKVDEDNKQSVCEHCGTKLLLDDEVQHIQYDNAEEAGYQFEKGRQRAQAENKISSNNTSIKQNKKSNTWLWVLGWIFCFPIPVMILIWRKKNTWPVKTKTIVTIVFWIVFLIIGAFGNSDDGTVENNVPEQKKTEDVAQDDTIDGYDVIDTFIEKYNEIADNKITNPVEIDIKDSEHYRTEYRLTAFNNAVAKQCSVGGTYIDIVNYGSMHNDEIRMYLNTDDEELAISVFTSVTKVLDNTITDEELSDAVENLKSDKSNNVVNDINYYFIKSQSQLFIDSQIDFYEK